MSWVLDLRSYQMLSRFRPCWPGRACLLSRCFRWTDLNCCNNSWKLILMTCSLFSKSDCSPISLKWEKYISKITTLPGSVTACSGNPERARWACQSEHRIRLIVTAQRDCHIIKRVLRHFASSFPTLISRFPNLPRVHSRLCKHRNHFTFLQCRTFYEANAI